MKALSSVGLRTIGIAAVLGLGFAVSACDEDGGGGMPDDQLGAVPGSETAPLPPAAEPEPLPEQSADQVQ